MATIRTVTLKCEAGAVGATQAKIPEAPTSYLVALRDDEAPAVVVVWAEELKSFRGLTDLTSDRREQNAGRTLPVCLLGKGKIPLIAAKYVHLKSFLNGVRDLLDRARALDDLNIFVIGVNSDIFEALWEDAEPGVDDGEEEEGWTSAISFDAQEDSLSGDGIEDDVLNGLPKVEIPSILQKGLIGHSPQMTTVRDLIARMANAEAPVLVQGETGSGKEKVAHFMHCCSARATEPFVVVNVNTIAQDMLNGELFGWKKGAFTGAVADKPGLWEVAGRGSLFLDEIGDLQPDDQGKILRALAEGLICPRGAKEDTKVHARVIAATNRDLGAMVTGQTFRADLYYRLAVLGIRTPSLRERPEDIPEIASFLWKEVTKDQEASLPEEIGQRLRLLPWPGNVRELKGTLISLHTLYGNRRPSAADLEVILRMHGPDLSVADQPTSEKGLTLHKAQCLQCLKRADEEVRAVKVAFRPLSKTLRTKTPDMLQGVSGLSPIQEVDFSLARRLRELDLLCTRPLFFNSQEAYKEVYQLKGMIIYTRGLLREDEKRAKHYYKNDLKPQIDRVGRLLFSEVEKLLATC